MAQESKWFLLKVFGVLYRGRMGIRRWWRKVFKNWCKRYWGLCRILRMQKTSYTSNLPNTNQNLIRLRNHKQQRDIVDVKKREEKKKGQKYSYKCERNWRVNGADFHKQSTTFIRATSCPQSITQRKQRITKKCLKGKERQTKYGKLSIRSTIKRARMKSWNSVGSAS